MTDDVNSRNRHAGFPNPETVPPALVAKYATRGPRYTSYPTAPQFRDDVPHESIAARWRESNASQRKLSLYFHIPFCRERCWFCGCHVIITKNRSAGEAYVKAVIEEMALLGALVDRERLVDQIAFGGGTPTFLLPEQLDQLISAVRSTWHITPQAEISIEVDPRTVTTDQIDLLMKSGFNRFSLGVQDFDEGVLDSVHRRQGKEITQRVVRYLRERGCEAINFDLIYGLPGQDMQNSADTMKATIEMRPSRIALYNYAHVPWMKPHQKLLEKKGLPDADLKLRIFGQAYRLLADAGYISVGMDHFALPEDEMTQALENRSLHRNFMGYTTRRGLDLVAFGISGISSVAGTYAQNVKELPLYYDALAKGAYPWDRCFLMSEDDQMRRELIIDLFCNFYLDTAAFSKRWKIDFHKQFEPELRALETFVADGLLVLTPGAIELTPVGRYFIRNVCMAFDRYLEQDAGQRMYSKTL